MSRGNYAACSGAGVYINQTNPDGTPAPSPLDGLFGVTFSPVGIQLQGMSYKGAWKINPELRRRPAAVHDGLSNTMAASEVCFINSQAEGRGSWDTNMPGGGVVHGQDGARMPRAPIRRFDAFDTVPMCDLTIPPSNPMHCTQNRSDANIWAAAQPASFRRECLDGRRRRRLCLRFDRHGRLAGAGDHLGRGSPAPAVLTLGHAQKQRT